MTREPKKVPVITRTEITIIFQPCLTNCLIWLLMDMPAKAPTMVRGAVKLICPTDWITNSEMGEMGQAHSRPRMEQ